MLRIVVVDRTILKNNNKNNVKIVKYVFNIGTVIIAKTNSVVLHNRLKYFNFNEIAKY